MERSAILEKGNNKSNAHLGFSSIEFLADDHRPTGHIIYCFMMFSVNVIRWNSFFFFWFEENHK